MRDNQPISVFKLAASFIAKMPDSVVVPKNTRFAHIAEKRGAHQPVLVCTEFAGAEDMRSKLNSTLATLIKFAYEEAKKTSPTTVDPDLIFIPCDWKEKETGKQYIGLMVARSQARKSEIKIPYRQLEQSLARFQKYLIGDSKPGHLNHWDMTAAASEPGRTARTEPVYCWSAVNEQECEHLVFMAQYADLQGIYYSSKSQSNNLSWLYIKKEDLEKIQRIESRGVLGLS